LVFKYYLNTAKSEVFNKLFKYSGQSICPNTACLSPQTSKPVPERSVLGITHALRRRSVDAAVE